MDKKDKRRTVVFILFIFLLAVRLIKVTNPPLDYSSWRQVDTDSIARNFVEYKFNIFYPQLNYDGPMPNYVQLELQITTFITAVFYKLFGFNAIFGRLIAITFFMGSCFYLYRLVRKVSGLNVAVMATLFYGILPINVIYSRNIMPESALMFFSIAGIYYFLLWIDSGGTLKYLAAVTFTALAILTKIPSAVIGIPMIYLAFKKYGSGVFKIKELYIFPAIALGLPLVYFRWLGTVAEQKFVSGIGANMILPNFLNSIQKADTIKYLTEQFALKVFTVPGIVLFAVGILMKKRKEEYFYYAWILGCILHVAFIGAVIHLDYYLMIITPIIAIFMAYTAVRLFTNKRYQYFLYISLFIIFLNNAVLLKNAYKVQNGYISFGNYISSVTQRDDLIIIDQDSPELFYTSGRKGWRLYDEYMTVENVKTLTSQGARYLALYSTEGKSDIIKYLDENYKKAVLKEGYYLYKLLSERY